MRGERIATATASVIECHLIIPMIKAVSPSSSLASAAES